MDEIEKFLDMPSYYLFNKDDITIRKEFKNININTRRMNTYEYPGDGELSIIYGEVNPQSYKKSSSRLEKSFCDNGNLVLHY